MHRLVVAVVLSSFVAVAHAASGCPGAVYDDHNANGMRDAGERGLPGIRVSDGVEIAVTDRDGHFRLPDVAGRTRFVIKPAGWAVPRPDGGLPAFWRHAPHADAPKLRFGGMSTPGEACPSFGLQRRRADRDGLEVLLFADPQPKSMTDVDYYRRDIVERLHRPDRRATADLGLTLGDIVNDDLSLYPAMNAVTGSLGTPWLHVAGNHDVDADATRDEDALLTFRNTYGPDTFAWEEPQADFVLLDDVITRPGQKPAYVGGLREDQFRFLERYLSTHDPRRLLVVGVHIPFFPDGGETFRAVDRERLFALLKDVPKVLLLSAHGHVQRHVLHDAGTGWHGAAPLHEYNMGAACGAYWSGAKNDDGIPDATMADGTPNGWARLHIGEDGRYALKWEPAGVHGESALTDAMRLHAPRVLRRGAYPAWGVFANVWMGVAGERVEFRVDDGEWQPMKRVEQADPWLLAENVRDDEAASLRGYDRSPEAQASTHLWRGALPTSLAVGEHRVEVRAVDPWQGEQRARVGYRLDDAAP
ncbi:calcineurin-like phosphoesterase C-terminal domain-containing protein [Lysobacter xanthus]